MNHGWKAMDCEPGKNNVQNDDSQNLRKFCTQTSEMVLKIELGQAGYLVSSISRIQTTHRMSFQEL